VLQRSAGATRAPLTTRSTSARMLVIAANAAGK
jgi:hypothetical protein